MLIPLDYYRILGLPIQATAEQLQQAHRDRALQLPRREYSEVAIAARKQLLDEAYAILSHPEKRQAYDASFLAKTYDQEQEALPGGKSVWDKPVSLPKTSSPNATLLQDAGELAKTDAWIFEAPLDPHTPSIEIEDRQFAGALLILQELGEYELVLKLGRPYLSSSNTAVNDGRFGDPQLVRPDLVLTVALAYLELGREQWQQGQYENAATSLERGQDLLLRESLFPSVRGEMQADLYKLRPYRVLELLALPEEKATERRHGLQIFREMLQERGGIDGQGDDRSGLGIEDFLRFIQQLRKHLTTSEQQNLFEAEARRPSAVATYLAVYTLLAQGFATRKPAMIRRAKLMLMQLGRRQDVHLEKAVCALLLGQTEEASRALELSSEKEPLAFIRENSKDSPDLLPGLCLYAEHWLQEEVFPHFRDLASQKVSLKDYFADPNVQAYLEALPTEGEGANEWIVVQQPRLVKPPVPQTREQGSSLSPVSRTATVTLNPPETVSAQVRSGKYEVKVGNVTLSPATSARLAERGLPPATTPDKSLPERGRRPAARERKRGAGGRSRHSLASGLVESLAAQRQRFNWQQISSQIKSAQPKTTALLVAALLAILLLGFLTVQAFNLLANALQSLSGPTLSGEQALVGLEQPPIEIPQPEPPSPLAASGPLSEETGQQIIEQWLTAKKAALGEDRAIEELKTILVDPALSKWVQMAEAQQRNNTYQRYDHTVKVTAVRTNETDPNRAEVEADITEKAEVFERGQQINSRDDSLRVRYQLVQQEGEWRIRDWEILK